MTGISVLIYTKNEQQDLPGCLESVAWCDDIHVFDSMSVDSTAEIARAFGAKVTLRDYGSNTAAFGGDESAHRNHALQHLAFKHDWVFMLDADERVTPELRQSMTAFVAAPGPHVAMRVKRRDYFMGRWLKHVTPSPFNIRLFKRGHVRYERITNPVTLVDGPIADTASHFNHYPFSKGMTHWVAKHNSYSTAEAGQILANRRASRGFSVRKAFFCKDASERRFHQKELYYRLPCRPLVMFLLLYVLKRGFLDGRAGFSFSVLRAIYEYMIVAKVREAEAAARSGGPA